MDENAVKLHVVHGETLQSGLATITSATAYDYLGAQYEEQALSSRLTSVAGSIRVGAYLDGQAEIGVRLERNVGIGAGIEGSLEVEGISGYEETYEAGGVTELARVTGGAFDVEVKGHLGPYTKTYRKSIQGLMPSAFFGMEAECLGKVWRQNASASPHRVECSLAAHYDAGSGFSFLGWGPLDLSIGTSEGERELGVAFNYQRRAAHWKSAWRIVPMCWNEYINWPMPSWHKLPTASWRCSGQSRRSLVQT